MKLSEVTSKFVMNAYQLNDDMPFSVETINGKELLCSKRLDIVAKMKYLELKDISIEFAKSLYLEHIRVMTKDSFIEAGSNKTKAQDFIDAFVKLYEDMKENGFREDLLPVPVDKNGVILDGAHRVACSIVLNIPVKVVKLPIEAIYDNYDYSYFEQHLMEEDYLDYLVLEYIKEKNNIGCINIWPSAVGHDEEVKNILNDNFEIVYYKEISLNENGAFQYLAQIYKEYSWAQNNGDGFSGVYRKLLPCFPTFNPVRVYFIATDDYAKVTAVKEKIRDIFGLEKHSLHATDNYEETLEMSEILLNDNTIQFLNQSNPLQFNTTIPLLEEAKKYDVKRTIFTGSIVLALYGIREANDLDYVTLDDDSESHNDLLEYYGSNVLEMLNNPVKTFTYFGFRFLTLEEIIQFKKNRNESKDRDDIKLIQLFLSDNKKNNKIKWIQVKRRMIAKTQGVILKVAHKTGTYDFLRAVYKKIKGAH